MLNEFLLYTHKDGARYGGKILMVVNLYYRLLGG